MPVLCFSRTNQLQHTFLMDNGYESLDLIHQDVQRSLRQHLGAAANMHRLHAFYGMDSKVVPFAASSLCQLPVMPQDTRPDVDRNHATLGINPDPQ